MKLVLQIFRPLMSAARKRSHPRGWARALGASPPKRLKWTVIFVATDGSAKPVISCAAKMLSGLCLQGSTHDQACGDS